jgi:hypothetical protein
VRAALERSLKRLGDRLSAPPRAGETTADQALRATLARDIDRHFARPATPVAVGPAAPGAPPDLPPGPPIGVPGGWDAADECEWGRGAGGR